MKKEYVDLNEYNVRFKHLISGPAPVGRILNYLVLAGKGKLKHKNGNRDLSLINDIASAWCSEFMVGLQLVYYVEKKGKTVYPLYLTDKGKELYELIKDYPGSFDVDADPTTCRQELLSFSKDAYDLFFRIFKTSPICKNLVAYIINKGTNEFDKATFMDDYFEEFKVYYEGGTYNRYSRTPTGANRVPSLLQICTFFNCLGKTSNKYIFSLEELSKDLDKREFVELVPQVVEKIEKEDQNNEALIEELISKYGITGNVAREIITRNSSVQSLFRNNLIVRYGCKCAICNKNIETVLVASHIVPASCSNVVEKADCENGLLLCALHDKLFDRYLISFDANTGKLLYADCLKDKLAEYQLQDGMHLEERFMTQERKEYLLKHNTEFYERNK